MRVPLSPGPQVEQRPLVPPYQQISAPPDAFGAGIAQETRRAGAVLGQAADQTFARAQQVEDQGDATAAQAAYLAATKTKGEQFYNPDTGIAFRQGINARGMTTDAMRSMEEIGRTTRDGLTNDRQRQAFDRLWGSHSATETTQLSRREATENQQARAEVEKGMLASTQTFAAQNNNDAAAILGQADLAERAVRANSDGMAPELLAAKATAASSGVLRAAILARATDDPLGAQSFFEKVQGRLSGADLIALQDHMKPIVLRRRAGDIADSIAGGNPVASGPVPDRVRTSAREQGVDPTVALTIGHLETRNGTVADRPGSQFQGPFQMGDAAWAARGGTAADRRDPGRQVQLGVANVKHSQEIAAGALGRTPEGWETYMVHQQGDGGGSALLRADANQDAVAALVSAYRGNIGAAREAVRQNGGWDGMTAGQFRDTWRSKYARAELSVKPHLVASRDGTMTDASAPAFQAPDLAAWTAQAKAAAGGDPDLEQRAVAGVTQRYNQWHAQTAVARGQLGTALKDTQAALADGRDVDIPEDRVRRLLPPEQADEVMGQLHEARLDGQVMGQVRLMGAADLSAAVAAAGEGLGPGGGTATEVEGYRQRSAAYNRLKGAVEKRDKQLADDPARYAAQSPAVASLYQARDPKRPETMAAYVQGSMAEQARLGVPEGKRRALPVAEADGLVGKLTTLDPSQADVGAEMGKMAQSYGAAWPAVFGDLVKAKLPGMYQVLPVIPDAAVRGAMQQALATATKKGGISMVRDAAPPDEAKEVDRAIDGELDDFRATTANQQGGVELFDRVRDAAKLLGYHYAMNGQRGAKAAEAAVSGILGAYEFDGTMRFPKGLGDDVRTSTRYQAMSLRPEDIRPVAGNENLSETQRKDVVLRAVRNDGAWLPNEDDTGLVLAYRTRDGGPMIPVKRTDGGRVEVRFDSLPKPAAQGNAVLPGTFATP